MLVASCLPNLPMGSLQRNRNGGTKLRKKAREPRIDLIMHMTLRCHYLEYYDVIAMSLPHCTPLVPPLLVPFFSPPFASPLFYGHLQLSCLDCKFFREVPFGSRYDAMSTLMILWGGEPSFSQESL